MTATTTPGAALDVRIAALEAENEALKAELRNGFLLVCSPADAFLARDPWARRVCALLGVQGVRGFSRVVRPVEEALNS